MKSLGYSLLFGLLLAKSVEGQAIKRPTADKWGKYGSVARQNQLAKRDKLSRLPTLNRIRRFAKAGYLRSLSTGNFLIDAAIPEERRYARPWTIEFLNDLNDSLRINYGINLIVTSCVRDAAKQRQLQRRYGKGAAPAKGENASTHLTGAACDFSDRNLGSKEISYIKRILDPLEKSCMIDEKPHGPDFHFHVFVSRTYITGEKCSVPIPKFKMPKINLARIDSVKTKYALKP